MWVLMIYDSTSNDEKRIVAEAHPNIHIVCDIYNDDWLIDYYEGGEEDVKLILNRSSRKKTILPFISSGTF